jgi:hypothetical protein
MTSNNTWLKHLLAILFLLLVNVVYFFPQIQGKVLRQGDLVSSDQGYRAVAEYSEKFDKTYFWNPAQFGGMPMLTGAANPMNLVSNIYGYYNRLLPDPIGMYFMGCVLMYILFVMLGLSPMLAAISSFPVVYGSGTLILWGAGHAAKIRTLIFTPLLIGGVWKIFEERKYLMGFLLLTLGFSFSFYARHPQMTYYVLLGFLIYGILYTIQTVKNKEWVHFAKGVLLVVGSILLGVGTSATRTFSLYDYSKVTMRGDAILKSESANSSAASSSNVDGLEWNYATAWSNGVEDLMAMYIPGFAGGGSGEEVGVDSESYKRFRIRNAPLYWGKLPFTEGPLYFGATILFLFVLGLFILKGTAKWWLGITGLWMILLSMGDHFELLNRFIFEYFPFYSKFRAPQTVLNAAPYFFVLMAGLTLHEVWQHPVKKAVKKKQTVKHAFEKPLLITYGICGGVALYGALLAPSFFTFTGEADARYVQQGVDMSIFIADRKALMVGDSWRSFFLITGVAGLVWFYLKGNLNRNLLGIGLGFLFLVDLMGVNWRYLKHNEYIAPRQLKEQTLTPRAVDLQIQQQEGDRALYRVHDLTIDAFNSSYTSAFHNTIGGYDPAKMQRYQDLIDRHITRNNQGVFNMLNTKYFIVDNGGTPVAQTNSGALGNAWTVGNIMTVNSPEEEINALNSIDPAETAVVLASEFPGYLDNLPVGKDEKARIELTNYEPDRLVYSSVSGREQLAVFSEIWYGPNRGWKAYIDGQEVEHIRVNYALRGLRVPAGQHEIVFEFIPRTVVIGEPISLVSSLLVFGLLGFTLWRGYKKD